MVRRADVLEGIEREADGPYEAQPLAKRAPASRRRVTGILVLAGVLLAIEAAFTPHASSIAAALFVLIAAGLLHTRKLTGLAMAAFAALLAIGVPLAMLRLSAPDAATYIRTAVSVGLALAAVPDIITLARDAELQYSYGVWARRVE